MEKEIIKKISTTLETGNFNEQNTLYLLAEIRKLLEKIQSTQYKIIYFYSDWVVHPKLDRKPAKAMLKFLEGGLSEAKTMPEFAYGFLSFQNLKRELLIFFKTYNIKEDIFEDSWQNFLNSLINIIIDCPLENIEGYILKSFKFSKSSQQNSIDYEAIIDPTNLPHLNHGAIRIEKISGTILKT